MKSNIIQIEPVANKGQKQAYQFQDLNSRKCQSQQNNKIVQQKSPLIYLQPKNYRYFQKPYVNQSGELDCSTIVADFVQYHDLLVISQKKVIQQMNSFVNEHLSDPIFKILEFYSGMTKYTALIMQKLVKSCLKLESQVQRQPEKRQSQLNQGIYCYQCRIQLINNQIQAIKNDLQIRNFQDKYKFYKIDAIKLYQLRKLRNYSNLLVQSELAEDKKQLNISQKPISLEQFEQVLNLLGSDIHKKNIIYDSGITHINQAIEKIDSQSYHAAVEDQQLKSYQFFVGKREMNRKLTAMLKKFFDKYNKVKASKRKDAEIQALIKDSEVIREQQSQIKELKMKLIKVESEKIREAMENSKVIIDLNNVIKELKHKVQQVSTSSQFKINQYSRSLSQQKNQIQILKKELSQKNMKYSKLQMQLFQLEGQGRNQTANSKKTRTQTKRRSQFDQNKQTLSPKKRKKQKSLMHEINQSLNQNIIKNDNSESNILSQKRLLHTAAKNKEARNTSIMQKRSIFGELNPSQAQKTANYEIIVEGKQEQQHDNSKKPKTKKYSRFHMFSKLSKFNIKNQPNSSHISGSKPLSSQSSQCQIGKQKCDILSAQRVSQSLFDNALKKLYEFQLRSSNIQNISYDNFAFRYQKFIQYIQEIKQQVTYSECQNQEKEELREKKDSSNHSLSRKQSIKDPSNINILKKKGKNQLQPQAQKGKKVAKLQPLSKKSNCFLHKNKNFSSYQPKKAFSAFSSLEQSRAQHLNPNITQVFTEEIQKRCKQYKDKFTAKLDQNLVLKPQQILNLFVNMQKINEYENRLIKNLDFVMIPQENQFIMNTMALLAELHLHNFIAYDYLKSVILNPRFWASNDTSFNDIRQEQFPLQSGLKNLIFMHRTCKDKRHKKQLFCEHLLTINALIHGFIEKQPKIIQIKKQKLENSKQKSLTRKKSLKLSLLHT